MITLIKRITAYLFLVIAASCIDPYVPDIKNYSSLLVVEGLVSNEYSSYKIKLGRTFSEKDSAPEMINDASVFITDRNGKKTDFQNYGGGIFKTDSTSFTGVIGQKYTLHIITDDGKEYRSDECTMLPDAGIDSLYYEKADEISGILGESFTGIKIMLNSADASGIDQYKRWTFEEVWKFILPGTQQYTYNKLTDTTYSFRSVPVLKNTCWKMNQSTDILINADSPLELNNQEIAFIAPIKSDRLEQHYSILVKQYSISQNEHNFWSNLKKIGEAGGDIFASQPFTVTGNIQNVNNKNEKVLGYFEVSAVSQKRIFITAHELDPLLLPHYKPDCFLLAKSPSDWFYPQPSWDQIYHMFVDVGGYIFVKPIIADGSISEGIVSENDLVKLVFSTKECSFCKYTGSSTKPDFWIDP
jgi:hypothetical protein